MGHPEQQFGAFVLVERLSPDAAEVFRAHRVLEGDLSGPVRLARFGAPTGPSDVAALVRAARWAERCHHPGVIRILEVGRLGPTLYLVSELGDGIDLEHLLIEAAVRGLSLPLPFIAGVGRQLATLARELHHTLEQDEPILIEYLRPSDVVVTWDGRVRLRHSGGRGRGGLAHDVYLAPDFELGVPATERTDVWVIGRLLRTLLSGEAEGKARPRSPAEPVGRAGTGRSALVQHLLGGMLARDASERPDVAEVEGRLEEVLTEVQAGSARAAVAAFLTGSLLDLRAGLRALPQLSAGALIDAQAYAARAPAPELFYPLAEGTAALDGRLLEEDGPEDRTDLVARPSPTEIQNLLAAARAEAHPPLGADEEPDTSSGDPVLGDAGPGDAALSDAGPRDASLSDAGLSEAALSAAARADANLADEDGGLDLDAIASSYVEEQSPARPRPLDAFSPGDTLVTRAPVRLRQDELERHATDIVERPAGLLASPEENDIFASLGTDGGAGPFIGDEVPTRAGRQPTRSEEEALGPLDALPLADVERTYAVDGVGGLLDDLASFEEEPTPTTSVPPAAAHERTSSGNEGASVFTAAREAPLSYEEGTAVLRPGSAPSASALSASALSASALSASAPSASAPSASAPSRRPAAPLSSPAGGDRTEMLPSVPGLSALEPSVEGTGVFESGAFSRDIDDEATIQLDEEFARAALARALGRSGEPTRAEEPLEKTSLVSAEERGPLPAARVEPSPDETALLSPEPIDDDAASETGEIFASPRAAAGRGPDEDLGVLVVEVPPDAVVFVNGVERGRGRVLVSALNRFTSYQVRVHRRRHHPWTAAVSLKGEPAARIVPDLQPR